jgi:hypothetical protein
VQAKTAGTLHLETLSKEDRALWEKFDIPVMLGWLSAMLDWPDHQPHELRCPTLWLAGSENEATIASMVEYRETIAQTLVETHIMEGLNHRQEFEAVEQVLPVILKAISD